MENDLFLILANIDNKNPHQSDTSRNNALWKILSALRGPDSDDERLKYLTTCRIRSVIGLHEGLGLGITINKIPLTDEERLERNHLLYDGNNHFHSHYIQAVKAIKEIFKYDLLVEQEVK